MCFLIAGCIFNITDRQNNFSIFCLSANFFVNRKLQKLVYLATTKFTFLTVLFCLLAAI